MAPIGKYLVLFGVAIAVVGLAIWGLSSVPFLNNHVGRLPGDIYVKRPNFSFYFPITTSIILSIVATIVLSLMRR